MRNTISELTPLESAAIDAILQEVTEDRTAVEAQLRHVSVVSRENTGGGFFTTLACRGAEPATRKSFHLGQEVGLGVQGLEHGLGMILHFEEGLPTLLEGYAVGPENTSPIDFMSVRYRIIAKPGPYA